MLAGWGLRCGTALLHSALAEFATSLNSASVDNVGMVFPRLIKRSPVRLGSVIIPARILSSCALATVSQSVFRFKKLLWRSLSFEVQLWQQVAGELSDGWKPLEDERECVKEQAGSVQQEQLAGKAIIFHVMVLDETDHGLAFSSSMCIKTLVKKQGGKSSVRVRVGLTGRPDLLAIGSLVSY
ncbi:hypothetical protein MCOR28_002142 [Pyricularia oryzae]|nr:hypothetical protein MCOR26_000252 [Pyricularia oryzae]KAI6347794.1 hypothetical protein MCOR28_002142 [Pyricularia oryzae]